MTYDTRTNTDTPNADERQVLEKSIADNLEGAARKLYANIYSELEDIRDAHLHGYIVYQKFATHYETITTPSKFTNMMSTPNLLDGLAIGSLHSSISKRAGHIMTVMDGEEAKEIGLDDTPWMEDMLRIILEYKFLGASDNYVYKLAVLYSVLELIQYRLVPDYAEGRSDIK